MTFAVVPLFSIPIDIPKPKPPLLVEPFPNSVQLFMVTLALPAAEPKLAIAPPDASGKPVIPLPLEAKVELARKVQFLIRTMPSKFSIAPPFEMADEPF